LLATSLAEGQPAPPAYEFDPTNGLQPDHTPFPDGAEQGEVLGQPVGVVRLARAAFSWRGGTRGTDRPLDRAFVRVERHVDGGWRRVHDDLGITIEWRVEGNEQVPLGPGYVVEANEGRYTAHWEVPLDTTPGHYRFVVTAKQYRLASASFPVARGAQLGVAPVRASRGRAAFTLAYPQPEPYADLTWRPQVARGTPVTVLVSGERVRVTPSRRGVFEVAASRDDRVVVPAGTVGDPYGNRTGRRTAFTAGEPTAPRPREPYPILSPW
jgi:neutral ceramidase